MGSFIATPLHHRIIYGIKQRKITMAARANKSSYIEKLKKEIELLEKIKRETSDKKSQRIVEEKIKIEKHELEYLQVKCKDGESWQLYEIAKKDMPEIFSSCPHCKAARDCISYFKKEPSKNRL
jgi:hypothetical protein